MASTICNYFLSCPYLIQLSQFRRPPSSYLGHGIFAQIPIFINFFLLTPTIYKCQDIHSIPGHSLSEINSTVYEPKLRTVLFSVVSGTVIISISDSNF